MDREGWVLEISFVWMNVVFSFFMCIAVLYPAYFFASYNFTFYTGFAIGFPLSFPSSLVLFPPLSFFPFLLDFPV